MARTNLGEGEKRRKSWFSFVQQTSELLTKNWLQSQHFFLLCICYKLRFLINKQCLHEVVMMHNLTAIMCFEKRKKSCWRKQGLVRLSTKIWTRLIGRKNPSVTIWATKPCLQFEGLLISLWKASRVGKWLKFTLQLLAFLKNWPSYSGFVQFVWYVPHHFSKSGKT